MDLVQHSQVEKVSRLLERGFDPNYHDSETGGEAPANTGVAACTPVCCP